jgi:hypothetical protein
VGIAIRISDRAPQPDQHRGIDEGNIGAGGKRLRKEASMAAKKSSKKGGAKKGGAKKGSKKGGAKKGGAKKRGAKKSAASKAVTRVKRAAKRVAKKVAAAVG